MWPSNQRGNYDRSFDVDPFQEFQSNQSSSIHTKICDLSGESNSSNFLGLIISKEGPRSFISKKGSGSERNLISFTIRDDPDYFINVTCWGGKEFTTKLDESFYVGHVIEIKGAQVQAKSKNPSDEKFKPWTPSPFCLNVSENHSEVKSSDDPEAENLTSLLHTPTRDSNDFYTLEDIQANGRSLQSEHVNILALVKKVWPVRDIVTKTGKKTIKADVVLCDDTGTTFQLTLWDSCANLTLDWRPLQTVIFASDVRASYSDYHSAMTASTDSKTIITVDPDVPEAYALNQFGKSQSINAFASSSIQDTSKDPEVSSIKNIVKIRELREVTDEPLFPGQSNYGVLFAFLSHFDIDAESKTLVRNVCKVCHRKVDVSVETGCSTPNCTVNQLPAHERTPLEYTVVVNLSDGTGTLESCYVSSSAMESLLELTPFEFQSCDRPVRTELKWRYLFERVRAVVKVTSYGHDQRARSLVRVMALEKAVYSDDFDKYHRSF